MDLERPRGKGRRRRAPRPEPKAEGARPRRPIPRRARPFASPDEMLEMALAMFRCRTVAAEAAEQLCCGIAGEEPDPDAATAVRGLQREAEAWARSWHRCFERSAATVPLCARAAKLGLGPLEREIVTAFVLGRLSLVENEFKRAREILDFLRVQGTRRLEALRCLSEDGRLCRSRLLTATRIDEEMCDRTFVIDPGVLDEVLSGRSGESAGWDVGEEKELHDRLARLTRLLKKKAEESDNELEAFIEGGASDLRWLAWKIDGMVQSLQETLALHPGWRLTRFFRRPEIESEPEAQLMLLGLLGKELGHLAASEGLFRGGGLARAASRRPEEVERMLPRYLGPAGVLVVSGHVQPCVEPAEHASSDPDDLAGMEFELTQPTIDALGIVRQRARRAGEPAAVRPAAMRLDQLVLPDRVRQSLSLAVAQARNRRVLEEEWGIGDTIAYGRGVTILFCGPPGVGKTACAEALAHELGIPILVAEYSEIENCYVGQTEKNVVSTFSSARQSGALLFWDEADAMFYDRDAARRTWEVRDVNVLLQELERFEGVCVLATNRRVALDAALERRISLKVEFERPDRAARRLIWEKLIPPRMPLAPDVDLDRLSRADLSGGEIKNAVLNASRLALARGPRAAVTHEDFEAAVEMEVRGRLDRRTKGSLGFE